MTSVEDGFYLDIFWEGLTQQDIRKAVDQLPRGVWIPALACIPYPRQAPHATSSGRPGGVGRG